eukprot:m.73428 g.73428  ORF g.73428 m.73428 type:complete len:72 (-) comp12412_c0_seq1:1359-1574(-)
MHVFSSSKMSHYHNFDPGKPWLRPLCNNSITNVENADYTKEYFHPHSGGMCVFINKLKWTLETTNKKFQPG